MADINQVPKLFQFEELPAPYRCCANCTFCYCRQGILQSPCMFSNGLCKASNLSSWCQGIDYRDRIDRHVCKMFVHAADIAPKLLKAGSVAALEVLFAAESLDKNSIDPIVLELVCNTFSSKHNAAIVEIEYASKISKAMHIKDRPLIKDGKFYGCPPLTIHDIIDSSISSYAPFRIGEHLAVRAIEIDMSDDKEQLEAYIEMHRDILAEFYGIRA